MKNYKFILVLVLVITFPNILQAKMYKWLDENGKVVYSNLIPPSSTKTVESSREVVEDPATREIRIENERVEKEEAAILEQNRIKINRKAQEEIRGKAADESRLAELKAAQESKEQEVISAMAGPYYER